MKNHTTERELAFEALRILSQLPSGLITFKALIPEIESNIRLTQKDRVPSGTRPQEEKWEQRVRNITSHRKSSGNYVNRGYLIAVRDGLAITQKGRAFISSHLL